MRKTDARHRRSNLSLRGTGTHRSRPRVPSAARFAALALTLALPIAACDSTPTGSSSADDSVIAGSIHSSASESPEAAAGSSPLAAQGAADAETVVAGEVASGGGFHAFAEGRVEADGSFRIEDVPAGRSDLVVVAYGEGDTEVGSVVLHEETRTGVEHRTHPIDARSTFQARTFAKVRARDGGGMGAAEVALFVHADESTASQAAASAVEVAAAAEAAIQARIALEAVLEAEGVVGLDAGTRAEMLAELAAERDRARDEGADAQASQEAFVSAALDAYVEAGARAEALALASAAAATAFDATLETEGEGIARLELARQALLLNLEARQRAVAEVDGNAFGMKAAVIGALDQTEAAVRTAGSTAELRASLEVARAEGGGEIVSAGTSALAGLGVDLTGEIESELSSAVAAAALWTEMETAASAQAMATAAMDYRAEVRAAVDAFLETVPSQAQAGVSAEVLAALFVAFGSGPDCG